MEKETKTNKKQLAYDWNYKKENYKQFSVRLRKDNGDIEKLEEALLKKDMNLKEYLMYHVENDLKDL